MARRHINLKIELDSVDGKNVVKKCVKDDSGEKKIFSNKYRETAFRVLISLTQNVLAPPFSKLMEGNIADKAIKQVETKYEGKLDIENIYTGQVKKISASKPFVPLYISVMQMVFTNTETGMLPFNQGAGIRFGIEN